MKRILFLIAALISVQAMSAQTDAIEKYFSKYLDDDRFTVVYISPKMFSMVSKMDIKDMEPEVKEIINNLRGLRILTTDINPQAFYKEALSTINTKEYEVLMKVRDGDENVQFLVKDDGGTKITELLLLVGGSSDFVLLSFVGMIDLNKISKLANSMDIKGAKHLEKIEKK